MTNLLLDEWIPVRRKDGTFDRVAPYEISPEQENPPVELRVGREDLEMATREWLIGLLQTYDAPETPSEWVARFQDSPPPPQELRGLFQEDSDPFEVDTDDRPFMQERGEDMEDEDNLNLVDLAMWGVSDRDMRKNRNHFVDQTQIESLCSSCAAMMLYMIQTQSPTVNYRYRGSPRGRQTGFVSTFLNGSNLWENITFNVVPETEFDFEILPVKQEEEIFPWRDPEGYFGDTQVFSEVIEESASSDDIRLAHPYQVYWTTPWRVCLNHENIQVTCDLCGTKTARPVTSYSKKSMGINYSGQWPHPLSPTQKDPDAGEIAYYSIPSSGLTYRDMGVFEFGINPRLSTSQPHEPATVIKAISKNYRTNYQKILSEARLEVMGYQIYSRNQPAHWEHAEYELTTLDEKDRKTMRNHFGQVVRALSSMIKLTRQRLERGIFGRYENEQLKPPEKDDINAGLYRDLQTQFWSRMELSLKHGTEAFVETIKEENDRTLDSVKVDLILEARDQLIQLFDGLSGSYNIEQKQAWYVARDEVQRYLKPTSPTVTDYLQYDHPEEIESRRKEVLR